MRRFAVDIAALRASRDLRLLVTGNVLSGLGTQAALVALPYQVYTETGSAFLTGLLGLVELGPLMLMALLGGALADRYDRRRILLLDQVALIATAAALAATTLAPGDPPIALLFLLAGLLAGFGALQNVAESSIVPNLVAPHHLRSAIAFNFGVYQLTMVVGPAIGGLVIGAAGVAAAYIVDATSCLAMVLAVAAMRAQLPKRAVDATDTQQLGITRSIAEGLGFVRRNNALMGSFAIDLVAMTSGMPRALFAVLAVSVYDAGAAGTGLLYASVAAGATVAALTTGWLNHARRLGVIVVWAVVAWGLAIAAAGLAGNLWLAAALLAIAGAADSVSAVCRSTINQTVTPDHMRGRMSSVFSLVVTSGPRLGDVEAGSVAAVTTPRFSVTSGGLVCVGLVAVVVLLFPDLWRYDAEKALAAQRGGQDLRMSIDPTDPATTTATSRDGAEKKRSGALAKENRRLVAGIILGAIVAVFAVLNLDDVDVNWIVGAGNTPLIVVIAVSFAAGVALGYLMRRTRERRRTTE